MRILIMVLMMGILAACGNGADEAATLPPERVESEAKAFQRRIFFVTEDEERLDLLAFEHTVLARETEVERGATLWHLGEEGWKSLIELAWEDQPIREPWRIVPHGPLRIIVDDTGELLALRLRTPHGNGRLSATTIVDEWTPNSLESLSVQEGEWVIGTDTARGLLVDIIPKGSPSGSTSTDLTELVLSSGAEFRLTAILPSGESGQIWVQRLTLAPETFDGVGTFVGAGTGSAPWHLDARGGELRGELSPLGEDLELVLEPLFSDSTSGGVIYQPVSGWIEVRGDRRSVIGLLRREGS